MGFVKVGHGTTNDGNTARKFFDDCQTSSEITGVSLELLNRFNVIQRALNSNFGIRVEKFREYCEATAAMYISEYPWFYMSTTVHLVLFHAADILDDLCIPAGQLSESAQEARHKDVRNFRREHTRKISRTASNEDLIARLLLTSDPVFSQKFSKFSTRTEMAEELAELLVIEESGDLYYSLLLKRFLGKYLITIDVHIIEAGSSQVNV